MFFFFLPYTTNKADSQRPEGVLRSHKRYGGGGIRFGTYGLGMVRCFIVLCTSVTIIFVCSGRARDAARTRTAVARNITPGVIQVVRVRSRCKKKG